MASSDFRTLTTEKPGGLMDAEGTDARVDNVPAGSSHAQSPVFDPRDGFFPRELLASDVPASPLLRAPRVARRSRWLLMSALLAVGAGSVAYLVLNAPRVAGPGPAATAPAAQAAKSNATATGSIAPAAASIAKPSASAASAIVAVPVSPPPVVGKAPAIAPAARAATESPREPQAYGPAPKGSQSAVTHTKSAAAVAAAPAVEPPQEPVVIRHSATTPAAPASPACSEAVAALGLCAAATKGGKN